MANPVTSEYIKIAEAARLLGVTQRWVYKRVVSGELPASKVGGLYFISRKDLQALMDISRVEPQMEEEVDEYTSLPQLKCSFCYRLLIDDGEIGGRCEAEGCGDIICCKCWDLRIRTCARHSPTREERLKKALEQKADGQLKVLVQANLARINEINFLNWIHMHLCSFSTLIHPTSGQALKIPSWDAILEADDERAELMQLLGKIILDSVTSSQQPLNAWHRYTIKQKKASVLEIHVQVVSRIDRMVRDGFDCGQLPSSVLMDWVEKLIITPAKTGNFRLVMLASTTGWDENARGVVSGVGGRPFSHHQVLLYLYDMPANELIYNTKDERTRRYAELFCPAPAGEELAAIVQAVINAMGVHDSLTLDEAEGAMPFSRQKIEAAFKSMAQDGEYVITDLKGLGITLVKRQAL